MTIALAWVATRSDGREDLYIASDSRTRGVRVLDLSPKILTLPRSDSVLCFAGDTSAAYALMLQIYYAIAAHQPARDRGMDISQLKNHLLHVLTDTMLSVKDASETFGPGDVQIIFCGYSWRLKSFQIWTIYYEGKTNSFRARPSVAYHSRLKKVAFIGNYAKRFEAQLAKALSSGASKAVNLEPLKLLSDALSTATLDDSIGGAPQLVKIGPHMNTRPMCVLWGAEKRPTLFGRSLFDYENYDYWTIDPDTGKVGQPRVFGRREGPSVVK